MTTTDPSTPGSWVREMRGFLTMWGGQLASLVGTSMTRFAVMIWGWQETQEATTLALLAFFTLGTTILLSPFAGALIDRWDRKKVLLLSDLGSAVTTLVLLLLYTSGNLEVWHLYAVVMLTGAFETFQFPAYSAAITMMIPKQHYARASGLISFAQSGSRIVGPPLAGLLLPLIGYEWIFSIDLISFLLAVAALALVHVPAPPASEEGGGRRKMLADASFGFRYILKRRGLLALQLVFTLCNFFAGFVLVLRAPMILARTGGDEVILGTVLAASGAGGVIGGLLLGAWGGPQRKIHAILLGWGLCSLGNLIVGVGQHPWVWMVGTFAYPFFVTIVNGSNQAIWQAKVVPDVQGRVFAARLLIAQVTAPLAQLLAGPLADSMFEPGMQPSGALAELFAPLVGVGDGAGMGLIMVIAGLSGIAVVVAATRWRRLLEVETAIPDHDASRQAAY